MARDKRILTKGGVSFIPLSLAAWRAQTSETTLRTWIEKNVKFDNRPIEKFVSPDTSEVYIAAPSLAKISERFVKWPSNEPAGAITIGETEDQSGYLGLPDAAKMVDVSSRTMWLWATQGKAPTSKPLDVVKCTTSSHFYIRHRDISLLRSAGRPRGQKRGPKPRSSLQL